MSDGISDGSPFGHRSWNQIKTALEECERFGQARTDELGAALKEIAKLRAERDALLVELDRKCAESRGYWGERDEARARADAAESSLSRAREALAELADATEQEDAEIREGCSCETCARIEAALRRAREILASPGAPKETM